MIRFWIRAGFSIGNVVLQNTYKGSGWWYGLSFAVAWWLGLFAKVRSHTTGPLWYIIYDRHLQKLSTCHFMLFSLYQWLSNRCSPTTSGILEISGDTSWYCKNCPVMKMSNSMFYTAYKLNSELIKIWPTGMVRDSFGRSGAFRWVSRTSDISSESHHRDMEEFGLCSFDKYWYYSPNDYYSLPQNPRVFKKYFNNSSKESSVLFLLEHVKICDWFSLCNQIIAFETKC